MRVLFFTTGMTAGGSERVVATLANHLTAQGHRANIAMIKGEQSDYELDEAVALRSARLHPGLRNVLRSIRFYRRAVAEEAPDLVASFATKSDIIALVARLIFRVKVPLVVSERNDPNTRKTSLQWICNRLYPLADLVVCQSSGVAAYYRARGAHTVVIPNPLNENAVADAFDGERDRTILVVGRLHPQKNHLLAISVLTRLRVRFPQLTMKIYGEGPMRADLEERIQRLPDPTSVSLEGVIPDVVAANARAGMFLFTSRNEGFPNALLEAAASGIPAVTTDFSPGTAHEIIRHGVNGFIAPLRDEDALVSAAERVLSGELDSAAIAHESARLRADHRLDQVASAWLTAFLSAAGRDDLSVAPAD